MDNPKRQLVFLAVMGAVMAGYYAYMRVTAPEPALEAPWVCSTA